jgi:hypothetical protein
MLMTMVAFGLIWLAFDYNVTVVIIVAHWWCSVNPVTSPPDWGLGLAAKNAENA